MAQTHPSRQLQSNKVTLLNYLSELKPNSHNYNQKSIFWDREHLHNENLMLRNKIRQLEDVKTKTHTRLLRSEKQVVVLSTRQKEKGPDLTIFRSSSTSHLRPTSPYSSLRYRVESLKDEEGVKKLLLLRKKIRELRERNEELKGENTELKKTVKYTRMHELQEENKHLQEELIRLKKIITDHTKMREEMMTVFGQEKRDLKLESRREIEAKGKLSRELKEAREQVGEMSKVLNNRSSQRWSTTVQKLEDENNRLKREIDASSKSQIINSTLLNPNYNSTPNQEEMTKLEYSESAFSEAPQKSLGCSPQLPRNTRTDELTSLEILSAKHPTQEFNTPVKGPVGRTKEPSTEPILLETVPQASLQDLWMTQSRQEKEAVPEGREKEAVAEGREPAKSGQEIGQEELGVQEEYENDLEEYEDLMEEV